MKRRSDLSRRYMIYRPLPFFEPTEESEDINIDTRMILKVMTLVKPEVRFTGEKVLRIIQKIPKERRKNEFWIKDSLEKEACRLFESFHPKEIKIEFSYE
jgi:hypothetical protein